MEGNWEKIWTESIAELLIHGSADVRALARRFVTELLEVIEAEKEKENREALVR